MRLRGCRPRSRMTRANPRGKPLPCYRNLSPGLSSWRQGPAKVQLVDHLQQVEGRGLQSFVEKQVYRISAARRGRSNGDAARRSETTHFECPNCAGLVVVLHEKLLRAEVVEGGDGRNEQRLVARVLLGPCVRIDKPTENTLKLVFQGRNTRGLGVLSSGRCRYLTVSRS